MNAWTSFWTAWAAYFGWRTRVDPTPEQSEVQAVRTERDAAHQQTDDWINSGSHPYRNGTGTPHHTGPEGQP